MSIGNDLKVN
eukprot:gene18745-24510_t